MNKEYPKIQVVDEQDNLIGVEDYFDAIAKGSIRRASRVFVFDTNGNILMQKRSKNVGQPLLFDQSVGGHVDEGESYHDAAVREMKEEIGLEGYPLKEVVTSYREIHFFNAIYTTCVPVGTVIDFDRDEVESVHWMSVAEVDDLIENQPEKCTDSLPIIWKDLRGKLIQ